MNLDESEVEKIAHLARLHVDADQARRIAGELSTILELVAKMEQCPTDEVEPMAHPMDATQRLRVDEVTEINQREHFLAIAPATEDGHYLVPKVIE